MLLDMSYLDLPAPQTLMQGRFLTYGVQVEYLVTCSNELDQHPVQHLHLAAQGDLWGQALRVGLQA